MDIIPLSILHSYSWITAPGWYRLVHVVFASDDEAEAPLSARLQAGTSAAHTRIERSRGVRALMGFGAGAEGAAAALERREYMAWLVGLACVYA